MKLRLNFINDKDSSIYTLVYNLISRQPREIRSKCKCCGSSFETELYIEQDFCNRCYPFLVRELFNPENGKLTCKEFVEKIKKEIKE